MKLAIVGAKGRMGQAVIRLAGEAGITVTRALDKGDALSFDGAEAVIDFSHPDVFDGVVKAAIASKVALVSGTTGLSPDAALEGAAKSIPVLWEPNMSVGILVLGKLVKQALDLLGDTVDIEIVEAHHKKKIDAPSGTALRLKENALEARPGAKIGMSSLRGGDVIGDHTVHLLGMGERIELTHRATSRDLFAHGALFAAKHLIGKPPGRYRLADLV
jgi:4-hydroxy-tetrahydrodipicolinate reductase